MIVFMKLDKRYRDRGRPRLRTTTGDPEGEALDGTAPLAADELAEGSLGRASGRGRAADPAASAVKIDGERAYRLHRQGIAVEMPTRGACACTRSTSWHTAEAVAHRPPRRLGDVRPALAEALGGHCVTLRRTEIGPFSVEAAEAERVVPLAEALSALAGWIGP